MSHPVVFKIKRDGTMAVITHAPADAPPVHGDITTLARGGHVWPLHPLKRAAFRWLRRTFGDKGKVAAWTRIWRGPWVVVLPGGHVRLPGAFATHGDAVQAEVNWLLQVL